MIKQFFKKVLIGYLIIICCIYTPTAQAAGWSFGGFNFGNGSLNITKNGVKITTALVDSAPITSNLGAKILSGALRGASLISAISIIADLGGAAVDWVLDPANNAIKVKTGKAIYGGYYESSHAGGVYSTFSAAASSSCVNYKGLSSSNQTRTDLTGLSANTRVNVGTAICVDGTDATISYVTNSTRQDDTRSIPIPIVAQQILNNAKSGDTNAQADVTSAVNELVNSGTYDTPISQAIQDAINNGTLPKDTDTTNPTNPQIDTSSITAAIQSLASSFASAISNAFNGITSVINTSIDKLLNKQDQIQGELVNTGSKIDAVGGQVVGVGDKVDSVGGKVVGVGDAVKDVGGKVVGLNDSVDKVGDKVVGVGDKVDAAGDKVGDKVTGVGDKVDAAGDKVGSKVDSVGEKVTTVGDKVTGVGDKVDAAGDKVGSKVDSVGEKVTTVGDKVTGVGDKVDAAGEKTAEAIKESTKEITKKMDEAKPKDFELPAFCSWASKVCDFIDWVKTPNEDMLDEPVDIQTPDMPKMESTDITFGGQCPQNFDIDIDLFGKPVKFTLFDSSVFCQFLSDWIRIPVIFSASLVAVYILGGRRSD